MLDWIKTMSDKAKKLNNPTGLSPELLKYLSDDLNLIDEECEGLGQILLKYVVDGECEEVLLKLAGIKDAADIWKICHSGRNLFMSPNLDPTPRKELFKNMDSVDPHVLYRVSQVLHTACTASPTWQSLCPDLAPEAIWLETFVREALLIDAIQRAGRHTALKTNHILSVLEVGGHPSGVLADFLFSNNAFYAVEYFCRSVFPPERGPGTYLASHPKEVIAALARPDAKYKALVLNLLWEQEAPVGDDLLNTVVDLAVASAKVLREPAQSLLLAQPLAFKKQAAALVREKLVQGSAPEKTFCVGLLISLEGEASHAFLQERRNAEKSKKLVGEIDKYLPMCAATDEQGDDATYDDGLVAPEPKKYPTEYALSPEIEKDLADIVERFNVEAVRLHAEYWDRTPVEYRQGKRVVDPPTNANALKRICEGLRSPEVLSKDEQPVGSRTLSKHLLDRELTEFAKRHDLDLVPLIRLAFCVSLIGPRDDKHSGCSYDMEGHFVSWLNDYRERKEPNISLLDIASAFTAAGLSELWIERLYLRGLYGHLLNPLHLDDDAIWPFFCKYSKRLEAAMGLAGPSGDVREPDWSVFRFHGYQLLAKFPKPPKRFVALLWEQALGAGKAERLLARACLKNYPGKERMIINALSDGRKNVRAEAASWLRELRVTEAAGPIKKALEAEKYDEVKAAMMEALQALGQDLDKFLNRKKLLDEAQKGLAKPIPKDVDWFPFDRLPEVHWHKNGQLVPPEVVKWFIVQSAKLKDPEPSPLLRCYCAMMRPNERKLLGRFVLDCWLAHDVRPKYTQEEAEKEADRQLVELRQIIKQYPEWCTDIDENQARKSYLNLALSTCSGSATSSKGILAVAGACCDADVVPIVERYLKMWYGMRAAQCRALVRMLSWIEHPLAIQLLLSVGTRFRTKSIQKEAADCADRVAERKSWTRDEMADRTIPTAGFEPDGTQVIDYGQRQFTARLLEDFSIQLENQEGKVIASLPDANKLEDEGQVKELKKEFSNSKKELKQVLKFQKGRFYEAMCAQRQWRFEDWDLYLNRHPIVGRYCQRLVWIASRDNKPITTFRPLGDLSLTNYDDEPVSLEPDDVIQIAHQALLSADDAGKWESSLKDYSVEPLFGQFGRRQFTLTAERAKETAIEEFKGHLINTFKLRGRADKLGYTRGQPGDGGWFSTYHKTFAGLKLQAVIEFTGNTLPEEDRMAALCSLYFTTLNDDAQDRYSYARHPFHLSKVPAVLLSESWNDMKQIADDGLGYDPDWEKKTAY